MGISADLKQTKFHSEESKAIVNVIFTGNWMMQQQHNLLKPFGLTPQQYNVLRILRGQQNNPMTVLAITERMMDKMSNASRLVDKLLDKKLVLRRECPKDRRAVDVIILPAGLTLLAEIDQVQKQWEMTFRGIGEDKMNQLNILLDEFRHVFSNN
ncbi:MarR family winged helix-turn-helix transcriptional regulator [Aquirufa sp.]|jgi:DNA-binding MarR family transcriptional regulator|uniref:MarR family winged helix-turn-helix transcriptional regulator n=1 Tax=Aquirufa sp. TaxID=2676249 RepID=UPI0037BEA41E